MATITRENIGLLNDKIIVKVAGNDYLPSFEKALKNYSKNANIPGFRKGMVPAGMIKKMHGQAVFTDEVLRSVEKGLTDYMTNEKLDIFAQPLPLPENDSRQIDMNKPSEYAFAFEVGLKPEFSIDLAKEKLIRYKVTITEEMINEEADRQRLRHGKMTEPEEVAGDDNVLNVTFIESDEAGNEIENGIRKDNSLLVKYFSESFRPSLIGKKKDDMLVIQLNTAFDEKEREWILSDLGVDKHDVNGASKHFKMLITKVGFVEKAELQEEFFKAAFPNKEIKTEEEFRNTIKEELQSYFDKQSSNHLQHEVYHVLIDNTNIEFPESFLKRWIQNGGEEPKTPEQVEQEFPSFRNQLKWTLITEKIVRDNNLDISKEDIESLAKKQLFGYMGLNPDDPAAMAQPWIADYVNKMMNDRKFIEDAYHRVQNEKVFDWAESQVNAIDTPISVDDFTKELEKHQHHHH